MKYTVRQEHAYLGADETVHGDDALIEIGDDEFVLDSEYRGANRIVVAIATPVTVGYECDECEETFDTEHGLRVHEGSQH